VLSRNCKVVSVCDAIRCSSKQAAGCRHYVRGEIVLRAHTIVLVRRDCVCLVIHTYNTILVSPRIEDRVVPWISAIFLPRTHYSTRRWPFNTAVATAWFHFYYQLHQYSCSDFLGRKASRVVRAAQRSVCFVERHTGCNKFPLRHLTTWQQICGGGGGRNNQPPHPQAVMTELKQNWLDVCHSPRSSASASSWCTRRWVTGDRIGSSATTGHSPPRQCNQIFSALCGRITCRYHNKLKS
jgi:hypothetical protein